MRKYNDTVFQKDESIEILKVLGWANNINELSTLCHVLLIDTTIWKISWGLQPRKINEAKSFFIEEVKKVLSRKHKNVFIALNYIELVLVLASVFNGFISISAFASLFGIATGMASSGVRKKMCAVTAGFIKHKSVIKKKRKKKHDKKVFLAATKLNTVEVLISKAFIVSDISREKFVLFSSVKRILWYERSNQIS